MPYFGKPQRIKVDPEGSWMDTQAAEYFDNDSIEHETIPGQAHWHISLAEEAIQATKGTMGRLVTDDQRCPPKKRWPGPPQPGTPGRTSGGILHSNMRWGTRLMASNTPVIVRM